MGLIFSCMKKKTEVKKINTRASSSSSSSSSWDFGPYNAEEEKKEQPKAKTLGSRKSATAQ